jgi:hypothetical protein
VAIVSSQFKQVLLSIGSYIVSFLPSRVLQISSFRERSLETENKTVAEISQLRTEIAANEAASQRLKLEYQDLSTK